AHLERPDLLVGKVADYQIETVEIVAPQRRLALPGNHDFMPEAFESLFKNTQLIVIIDDEDPAFFHQAPILTSITRRDSIGCTKIYRHTFEIYQSHRQYYRI